MNFLYLFLWVLGVIALVISFTLKKEWRFSSSARKLAQISFVGFVISLIFLIIAVLMFALLSTETDTSAGPFVLIIFIFPLFVGSSFTIISAIFSIIYKGQEKPFTTIRKFIAYPFLILGLLSLLPSITLGVISDARILQQNIKWEQTKKITQEEAVNIAVSYIAKNNPEEKNPKLVLYETSYIPENPLNQPNPNNIKKEALRLKFTYDGSKTDDRNCSIWIFMDIVDGTIFSYDNICGTVAEVAPKESIAKTNEKIDIGNNFGLIISQPSDYIPSDSLNKPGSEMKFVALELTYFNDSKESDGVDPSNLVLKDSNNKSYKISYKIEKMPRLKYGTVVPANGSVKGFVVYEVPIDAKITNAVYSNSDVKITIHF